MENDTAAVEKRSSLARQKSSVLGRLKKHSWAASLAISLLSVGLTQIEPLRLVFATPEYFFATPKSMRIVSYFGVLHFAPIVTIINTGKKTTAIDRVDLYVEKRESATSTYRRVLRAEGHYFEPTTSNPNWIPTTYPLHFIRLTPEGYLSANVVYRGNADRQYVGVAEFQAKASSAARDVRRAKGIPEPKQGAVYDLGPTIAGDLRSMLETNLDGFTSGTYNILFAFTEIGKDSPSLTRAFAFEVLPDDIKAVFNHKLAVVANGRDEMGHSFEVRVRLTPITETASINRLTSAYLSASPSP